MKNKILKLVLTKHDLKNNIILKKSKGSVSSLIYGIMVLTIAIVFLLFTFRIYMLSEVIYTIDDTMTTAALGAATPNEIAYDDNVGYIDANQLVMQDADMFYGETDGTNGNAVYYKQGEKIGNSNYYYNEQSIVVSEANSKYIDKGVYTTTDLIANFNGVKELNLTSKRIGYNEEITGSTEQERYINTKISNRKIASNESYTINCLNNLMDIICQNISNSAVSLDTNKKLGTSLIGTETLSNFFTISKSTVLDKSFVGQYLSEDMTVTRLELYNVYRYTLAKRHVYASPYFIYKLRFINSTGYVEYTTTWDGYDSTGAIAAKDSSGNTVSSFNGKVLAARDYVNATYNDFGVDITVDGCTITDETNTDYIAWKNSGTYPLVFWEDTGISYQSDWYESSNPYKAYYGYLWNNDSLCAVKITASVLVTDTLSDGTTRYLLPIEGYSTYIYVAGSDAKIAYANRSTTATAGIDSSYFMATGLSEKTRSSITLGDNNDDGNADDDAADSNYTYYKRKRTDTIKYSSVYLETEYSITTFPSSLTSEYGIEKVRSARLVSVTKQ
jgi:hypothetical protein